MQREGLLLCWRGDRSLSAVAWGLHREWPLLRLLQSAQQGPLSVQLCPFVRGSFLIPLLNGENSGAILLEERSWKIRQVPPSNKFLSVWRARILTQFV